MNRCYSSLWFSARTHIPQKVLACLLAAVLGSLTLIAPNAYVRAENGTAEPVNLIEGQLPVEYYVAQRSDYTKTANVTAKFG